MRGAPSLATLLLLLARPALADDQALVTIDARDRPLVEVVETIAEASGRTIVVLDADPDELVTVLLHDAPWRQALEVVAERRWRRVAADGETLRVEDPPSVTIQLTDASARTILQLLAAYSGENVVVTGDVTGTLTLDLKEVPWDEALDVVSLAAGVRVTRAGALTVLSEGPLTFAEEAALRDLAVDLTAWPGDGRVTLRTDDLAQLRAAISAEAGVLLDADPSLQLPRELALRATPWREAVRLLVDLLRARLVDRGGRLVLEARPARTLQATDARLDLLLAVLGVTCADAPPRARVTADLRGCFDDEAVVALALAGGLEPSRVGAAWRFVRRPPSRPYVPEDEPVRAQAAEVDAYVPEEAR